MNISTLAASPMTIKSLPLIEVPFQHREGNLIQCDICPQHCTLDEGGIGGCGGRQVIGGRLVATNYGQVCSLQLDPIEKKPLFHFLPGTEILSVGPNGCNLNCSWCQNHQISQSIAPTRLILPTELADMVDAVDGIGVAYTYAEPLIWFEYIRDAGRVLHERKLFNVFISNGFINPEPLRQILKIADAFNIDLKSHDNRCYQNFCGGNIEDVQRTILMVHDAGKHLEIAHLVVTGVDQNLKDIELLVNWIAAVDPKIPLHLTRYFPANRYDEPATDLDFLNEAFNIAKSKLDYVYMGNTFDNVGLDSYCPGCGATLVKRTTSDVEIVDLMNGKCGKCGKTVPFVIPE
jgi:pyruvate formate lyase activating enzyme